MKTLKDLKERLRDSLRSLGIAPFINFISEGHACIEVYLHHLPPHELIATLPHEFEAIDISWIFDGKIIAGKEPSAK